MSSEFEIKGKVTLDATDLDKLPTKAAEVAKASQQKLSAIGTAVASSTSDEARLKKNETLRNWRAANPERSAQYMRDWRARQKGAAQGEEGTEAGPSELAKKIASRAATNRPSAAANQALATALGKQYAPNTGAALTSLTPSATALASQASGLGAALKAAAQKQQVAAPAINAPQQAAAAGGGGGRGPGRGGGPGGPGGPGGGAGGPQGGPAPRRPRAPRQPPSSSSRSGSLFAGLFRGLATTLSQGTGINIPFLSLSPTFIAGAAAASAFSLAIKAAFSNTIELGHAVSALHLALGGGITTTAQFAAQAQNSNTPVESLSKAIGTMEQTVTKDPAAFERLGIHLKDLSGAAKPLSVIFDEARSKIAAIKDPTLQASAASSLFQESYRDILPLLRTTDAQMAASAPSIAKQADQILKVQQQTAEWDTNTSKLGTNLSRLGQTVATPFIAIVNAIGNSTEDAAAAQDTYTKAWNDTYQASINAGKTMQQARNDADAARKQAIVNYVKPTAPSLQPAEAVKGPDINLLKEAANTSISAFQTQITLDQSLLDIDQQRAQTQFQISSSEIDIANMQFDQQQALSNQAQDRAMQLAEQVAALTISLNEFKAAEQSAAIRAREQEKSFFAFRPDNALVRADQEARYQRDRAQEIARNARTNALAARQLENQKAIAAFDDARATKEKEVIGLQKVVFDLQAENVKKEAETATTQLAAALINLKLAGLGKDATAWDVTFNFPKTGNDALDAWFATLFSGVTTDAISILRGQGNRGDKTGRIGGNQVP